MIKHIVMIKFHKNADGRTKDENLKTAEDMLNTLPPKINAIANYSVGINQLESSRAFDLCIVSEFESWDALNEYIIHPAHQEVVEFVKRVREVSHSCDYEIK